MDLLIEDKKTVLEALKSSCFVSFFGCGCFGFFCFFFCESEKRPLEKGQMAALQSKKEFDALLIPSSRFSTCEMKLSLALLFPECFTGIIAHFSPL